MNFLLRIIYICFIYEVLALSSASEASETISNEAIVLARVIRVSKVVDWQPDDSMHNVGFSVTLKVQKVISGQFNNRTYHAVVLSGSKKSLSGLLVVSRIVRENKDYNVKYTTPLYGFFCFDNDNEHVLKNSNGQSLKSITDDEAAPNSTCKSISEPLQTE